MDFRELFAKKSPPPKILQISDLTTQIEHCSPSIIYKYHRSPLHLLSPNQEGNFTEKHQQNFEPIKKTQEKLKMCGYRKKNVGRNKFCIQENQVLYQFEKYLVFRKILGQGSFSKVFLGMMKKTKKLVAIKEVEKLEQNQIACLMNSQSPFIIKMYDFWTEKSYSYIALQLCDSNLRQKLKQTSIEENLEFFNQLVEGMNYLYKKNIIHRDLKFQNILIKEGSVKISDFGFAKPIGSKLAVLSQKCGTPYTMAPEIYFHPGEGKPVYTHKCDIYSLGVILHELVYNKHPFDYCAQKLKKNQRIKINKCHGYLDVLIDRCLQLQVNKRCNWAEFLQIFTLYKMRKNAEQSQFRQIRKKQTSDRRKMLQKVIQKENLQKYKRKIFQTPKKKERNILRKKPENQNCFKNIKLSPNIKRHMLHSPPQKYKREEQKISVERNQQLSYQPDDQSAQTHQKPIQVDLQSISALKLGAFVFFILLMISLMHVRRQ